MAFFNSLPRPGSSPNARDRQTSRRQSSSEQEASEPAAETAPADESRFSLLAVFVTLSLGCAVLAVGRWLPPPLFAGITGFGLLAYGTLLWLSRARAAIWHLSWWALLVIYLFAVGMAISSGHR